MAGTRPTRAVGVERIEHGLRRNIDPDFLRKHARTTSLHRLAGNLLGYGDRSTAYAEELRAPMLEEIRRQVSRNAAGGA
jgi:hypothetical protein